MPAREYVHALGQLLEDCTDRDERVRIARMLAATGSADAQPYLAEAMAEESDEVARRAFHEALAELSSLEDDARG